MANNQDKPNTPNQDTNKTSNEMNSAENKSVDTQNTSAGIEQKGAVSGVSSSDVSGGHSIKISDINKTPDVNKMADSGASNESADKAASHVGEVLRGNTTGAKDAAMDALSQAKDSTGKVASQALGQVQEKATSQIDKQKTNLAQGLGSVAESIRQMGDGLKNSGEQTGVGKFTAQYGSSLADQVEQLSSYLDRKEVGELVRDVETFARRNPAMFIGGAFVLGVLGARFLKSSSPNQALMVNPNRRNIYGSNSGSSREDSVRTTAAPLKTSGTGIPEANKVSDTAADALRKIDQKVDAGGTENKTEGFNRNTRTL